MLAQDVQATWCATLVDEWIRAGMRHAVVAPGSRSTPMALALAARSELTVHVAHDERSASFIALGIGLASGVPAALLCSSGTAAAHFHAAVIEADLSGVPMLVLTADRPPELQGIGAPQTIDQFQLYGTAARWFHDTGVADDATSPRWRELAGVAWLLATRPGNPGPVHLNLPFREPLVGTPRLLPPVGEPAAPPPPAAEPDRSAAFELLRTAQGVIVAGRGAGDPAAVDAVSRALGWPVFADPRSGCRALPNAVGAFDGILRSKAFTEAHRPQAVLHLGEQPASKVLGQWLQATGAKHVHVMEQPRTIDPLHIVDERLTENPTAFCHALTAHLTPPPAVSSGDDSRSAAATAVSSSDDSRHAVSAAAVSSGDDSRRAVSTPIPSGDDSWMESWRAAQQAASAAIDALLAAEPALCEPAVARVLTTDRRGQLVVASSMPVRDVEWFGGDAAGLCVRSNRGANGIDGVMATGIGVAIATGQPTAVLLGDVAFCHDASSLTALAARGLDLTIVVTDNDGGGIFSFLPQATELDADRFEQLFGTPHGTDVLALAAAHGVNGVDVETPEELRTALTVKGTSVVRVRTNRAENVRLHDRLNAAIAAAIE